MLAKISLQCILKNESKDLDSTVGIQDTIHNIADSGQQDFEELIGIDPDKKEFVRKLSKVFAVLLNMNCNTAEKIKRVIKIAIEMTLKLWLGPRQQ